MPPELSIAQFNVEDPHVEMQRPGSVVVLGRRFSELLRNRPGRDALIQHTLSWNEILGSATSLQVDLAELRRTIRSSFAWGQFVQGIATALARLRSERAGDFAESVSHLALRDSWPARIVNWSTLLSEFAGSGRRLVAVSEHSILWLLADALAAPWEGAPASINAPDGRVMRFAMIAADLVSQPVAAKAARNVDLLVPRARLHQDDAVTSVLVRGYELYCELLPEVFPEAATAFERVAGVPVAQWVTDVCRFVMVTKIWLKRTAGGAATMNLSPTQKDLPPDFDRLYASATRLAATPEQFRAAFARLPPNDMGMQFRPLRQWPLLVAEAIGAHQFVVLHLDFLLGAADDGVHYRILDGLQQADKARFMTRFGEVFERYVERVLHRALGAGVPGVLIRLDDGTARSRKRCDFAWRFGDDLILIDAKRCGVNAAMLEGGEGLRARLDEQVATAASQFIATSTDIETGQVHDLNARLEVDAGWRPRRTFALLVHHQPLPLWFDFTREAIERAGVAAEWNRRFAAVPLAWSISEVELLETTGAAFDLGILLDAAVAGEDLAMTGLRNFFQSQGWKASPVSPYFKAKLGEILNR